MKGCSIYFTDPETREYFKGLSAHRWPICGSKQGWIWAE
jgi:hypothetical protein